LAALMVLFWLVREASSRSNVVRIAVIWVLSSWRVAGGAVMVGVPPPDALPLLPLGSGVAVAGSFAV